MNVTEKKDISSYNDFKLNFDLYPKQLQAFHSVATEILFGGATRGGKSFFTRVALITWSLWVPGLQSLIIRKYYDDVIQNHMEGPDGFRALLSPLVDEGLVKITENQIRFKREGSLITLNHCSTEEAAEKNQGIAKHVLVFEEACQILERHIRFIRGWVTMPEEMKATLPEELKGMFPKIIYTANPIGISMGYFRRNFVKAAPKGKIFKAPAHDGGFMRQYIEARVEDNPSEDASAVANRIAGLGDLGMSEALLSANWDAPIGDFFPQYDDAKHCTPDFAPPEHWFKFLTFDWGSSDPFGVIWWCVSDGNEFKGALGAPRWFPRGSLVAYREWYGCDPQNPALGLHMRNEQIANGIIKRTLEDTSGLVITDSLPFQDRGESKNGKKYTIADVFRDCGCPLVRGNCARRHGWSQMRDRLIGKDGHPLIYFVESARYTRDYIPALGYAKNDREDAAQDGEATHLCDCVRYACTTRPIVKDQVKKSTEFKKPGTILVKDILSQLRKQRYQNAA